jgi:organic hydroperoxide reductase OsmC/OhrA
MSDPAAVDPEEALVAALSSCHMLFFLAFAAKGGFTIDSYRDEAVGILGRDERGKISITTVALRPAVVFSGDVPPDAAAIDHLHHRAHQACYIANSIRAEVRIDPR